MKLQSSERVSAALRNQPIFGLLVPLSSPVKYTGASTIRTMTARVQVTTSVSTVHVVKQCTAGCHMGRCRTTKGRQKRRPHWRVQEHESKPPTEEAGDGSTVPVVTTATNLMMLQSTLVLSPQLPLPPIYLPISHSSFLVTIPQSEEAPTPGTQTGCAHREGSLTDSWDPT